MLVVHPAPVQALVTPRHAGDLQGGGAQGGDSERVPGPPGDTRLPPVSSRAGELHIVISGTNNYQLTAPSLNTGGSILNCEPWGEILGSVLIALQRLFSGCYLLLRNPISLHHQRISSNPGLTTITGSQGLDLKLKTKFKELNSLLTCPGNTHSGRYKIRITKIFSLKIMLEILLLRDVFWPKCRLELLSATDKQNLVSSSALTESVTLATFTDCNQDKDFFIIKVYKIKLIS